MELDSQAKQQQTECNANKKTSVSSMELGAPAEAMPALKEMLFTSLRRPSPLRSPEAGIFRLPSNGNITKETLRMLHIYAASDSGVQGLIRSGAGQMVLMNSDGQIVYYAPRDSEVDLLLDKFCQQLTSGLAAAKEGTIEDVFGS
uniref:Uncharacterized protein n=1 Tax=Globodera rostochiensis TaxID=31243 RepID=A0A914HF94_GLORO